MRNHTQYSPVQQLLSFELTLPPSRPRLAPPSAHRPIAEPRYSATAPHNKAPSSQGAAYQVASKICRRKARIVAPVRQKGELGISRDGKAHELALLTQLVTGPVRQLVDEGLLAETNRTRPTRHGSPAVVLARPEYGGHARSLDGLSVEPVVSLPPLQRIGEI